MNVLTPYESKHNEAVIIAEGPSKEKVLDAPNFCTDRSVAVVNRAGLWWPNKVDYWITYHAEWMSRWWGERELNGHPQAELCIVSANKKSNINHIPHFNITAQVRGLNSGGTSSILAAMVLLDMGYQVIHLFGVDMIKPYDKDRKFWKILKGKPLVFHGEDWFHRGRFLSQKES